MVKEFIINTPREGFLDITSQVLEIVRQSQGETSFC
jgi:thiamine phosphate synthase YjbQ (UPF0047 family)